MPNRILIVEDDLAVRDALAEAMAGSGAEIDVATDGVDALARLRSGPRPSVILLDLRLPRLGGEDFLREMRADPRLEHLPVITMTGGTSAAEGNGIVARLHKPGDLGLGDLREIVMSLLEVAA
jgi:CheY-like chemotaxis protein